LLLLIDRRQQAQREEQQRQHRESESPAMRVLRNDDAGALLAMINAGTCRPHEATAPGRQNMLHLAARMGKSRCVDMLVQRFFVSQVSEDATEEVRIRSIDAPDSNGSTALHLASFFGHSTITRMLLGKNANVHAKMNQGGEFLFGCCVDLHLIF
jgi:ankyrin repeat protein